MLVLISNFVQISLIFSSLILTVIHICLTNGQIVCENMILLVVSEFGFFTSSQVSCHKLILFWQTCILKATYLQELCSIRNQFDFLFTLGQLIFLKYDLLTCLVQSVFQVYQTSFKFLIFWNGFWKTWLQRHILLIEILR